MHGNFVIFMLHLNDEDKNVIKVCTVHIYELKKALLFSYWILVLFINKKNQGDFLKLFFYIYIVLQIWFEIDGTHIRMWWAKLHVSKVFTWRFSPELWRILQRSYENCGNAFLSVHSYFFFFLIIIHCQQLYDFYWFTVAQQTHFAW